MSSYLMGVDLGTTGAKAMIFDLDANVAGIGYREYVAENPKPDWFEFDCRQLIDETFDACREAVEASGVEPDEIGAVSFSTQRSTVGFIDKNDAVIGNVMYSWQDNRGVEEVEFQKSLFPEEEITKITGMPVTPTYCISNTLWFKKNKPEEYKKTKVIALISDLLMKRFGADNYYCDWGNASCTGIFDMRARDWSRELIDAFGLEYEMFPQPVPGGTDLGFVSEEAARRTGLSRKTKLIAGSGDQSCGALGSGVIRPGIAEMTIGTAGHLISYLKEPIVNEQVLQMMTVNAAVPGNYELNGIQLSAASIYRWFRDTVAVLEREAAVQTGTDPYVLMEELVKQSEPGARGLVLLPYFAATGCPHWNVKATGVLAGLTFMHTKGDMARAFMEGCMYEMREIVETMREAGVEISELNITGGAAKSASWRQIMADILNVPLNRLVISDATVLGAAILAGFGAGVFTSPQEGAGRMVKYSDRIMPIKENVDTYNHYFKVFQTMYEALEQKRVFSMLHDAREDMKGE
jgi:xylulokinase